MLMFVFQHQPHRAGTDLRRELVACLLAHGSTFSRVGASGKPGAVHFEEAGVVGAVGKRSVGSFPYQKRLKNGGVTVCEVHVFPLRVRRQRKQWPEKEQREVKWLSAKEA